MPSRARTRPHPLVCVGEGEMQLKVDPSSLDVSFTHSHRRSCRDVRQAEPGRTVCGMQQEERAGHLTPNPRCVLPAGAKLEMDEVYFICLFRVSEDDLQNSTFNIM